jgi:acetolactate synthase-1/2/3 large subunit
MNGAEALIRTALSAGIEVCFANPGTTEMPLVAALDGVDGMRAVLGLFEGVCTGAADGYARMADKPALTLLHLGPGFANGIANLHNARRARSAVVNVIGDHATWHLAADAPLTSDIVSLVRPVSAWIHEVKSASSIATDTADAIAAAGRAYGRIATLIVPSDCQWSQVNESGVSGVASVPGSAPRSSVERSADLLATHGAKTALFLGSSATRTMGMRTAARISKKTGCRLVCETFPARVDRGDGLPAVEKLPYFPEQATQSLAESDAFVLAGARAPVAFFGYPNLRSELIPEGRPTEVLTTPDQNSALALEELAEHVGAKSDGAASQIKRPPRPTGQLDATTIGAAIAALMPENCIVMDEAATTGLPFFGLSAAAPRHTYLALTGGAIGQGLPCASGAAVACPDRKVIAFQADGSGMYTLQALWTQARERLDVTTLICNNRRYRILQVELARAGITEPGRKARSLTSLGDPEINWVAMARGMGVPGVRVETAEDLCTQLERALKERGPNLIEMLI